MNVDTSISQKSTLTHHLSVGDYTVLQLASPELASIAAAKERDFQNVQDSQLIFDPPYTGPVDPIKVTEDELEAYLQSQIADSK